MGTLAYLWHHKLGRLAILLVLVGMVGLVFHYWTSTPLLLALPNRRELLAPPRHFSELHKLSLKS